MRRIAVGLCVRPADGALLVEHGRDRLTGERFVRAIGGAIEPGEEPAAAVEREWMEELALEVRASRALGVLDNRFTYEGRAGHEQVAVFEVVPRDPRVYDAERIEQRDPEGLAHVATWVARSELAAGAPPLYPAGVLALLTTDGPGA